MARTDQQTGAIDHQQQQFERDVARLQDTYERRLADAEALRAQLQQRLTEAEGREGGGREEVGGPYVESLVESGREKDGVIERQLLELEALRLAEGDAAKRVAALECERDALQVVACASGVRGREREG